MATKLGTIYETPVTIIIVDNTRTAIILFCISVYHRKGDRQSTFMNSMIQRELGDSLIVAKCIPCKALLPHLYT